MDAQSQSWQVRRRVPWSCHGVRVPRESVVEALEKERCRPQRRHRTAATCLSPAALPACATDREAGRAKSAGGGLSLSPRPAQRPRRLNDTCVLSVDTELFLHYSLIPSLVIILVLSFLQRRQYRRERDDTSLLGNHFAIIMPLDFVGTFSNRWSYGIAFGATANKVMFLFSEGYQPMRVPQWAQAFLLLIGGLEVGLAHFPFFACLSSQFRLVSSILGFCYSLIWFVVTILQVSQCPHGQFLGRYEAVMFHWPSLLCLAFLLGRFLHMFVKALRVHLGHEFQAEESPMLEAHQAEHVQELLRKPRPLEKKKSWFQTRIYEWDPCFHFPSRMIGTIVLAFICLYLFIVTEFCVFVYICNELDVFEAKLEGYLASVNQTGALTPVILQVKELISVTKGVWVVTILPASLTCVSYLFHILVCYRKHMKRLWAGDKHFLPLKFQNPSSSGSVVAIARYSGWQIAYILWGYLIIHVVQSLCGMAITYGLVLPCMHNRSLEMLQGLGIGILTVSIVVGLMILQVWIASSFFLQPKLGPADKQKPLALNNRILQTPRRERMTQLRFSPAPPALKEGTQLPCPLKLSKPGDEESVPQLQLLPVLLQRAAGPGGLPLPAAHQLCPGHVADRAHRQDHHAEWLRGGRHGVQCMDWHALRGPLPHQPRARQLLSHPDHGPQGEEGAEGHTVLVSKLFSRSPHLSQVQDEVVPAEDPDQQPRTHHTQKIKTRAQLLGVYPAPANVLRELALAPCPLPGQAACP